MPQHTTQSTSTLEIVFKSEFITDITVYVELGAKPLHPTILYLFQSKNTNIYFDITKGEFYLDKTAITPIKVLERIHSHIADIKGQTKLSCSLPTAKLLHGINSDPSWWVANSKVVSTKFASYE